MILIRIKGHVIEAGINQTHCKTICYNASTSNKQTAACAPEKLQVKSPISIYRIHLKPLR